MTSQSARRWDQTLFAILWTWVAFRTLLPWLVSFRLTFEGPSYSWGSRYFGHMFHSSGLSRPDVLVVYSLLAVSLVLLFLLRHHRFRVGRPLLLLYLGFFFANAVHQLAAGQEMIFQGDTLGVRVDLTAPFLLFNGGMFALAIAWCWGSRDVDVGAGPRAVSGYRRTIVVACAAFVPVQLALLIFGEPHGTTDAIGVIGTLLQWALLAFALYPGSDYRVEATQSGGAVGSVPTPS